MDTKKNLGITIGLSSATRAQIVAFRASKVAEFSALKDALKEDGKIVTDDELTAMNALQEEIVAFDEELKRRDRIEQIESATFDPVSESDNTADAPTGDASSDADAGEDSVDGAGAEVSATDGGPSADTRPVGAVDEDYHAKVDDDKLGEWISAATETLRTVAASLAPSTHGPQTAPGSFSGVRSSAPTGVATDAGPGAGIGVRAQNGTVLESFSALLNEMNDVRSLPGARVKGGGGVVAFRLRGGSGGDTLKAGTAHEADNMRKIVEVLESSGDATAQAAASCAIPEPDWSVELCGTSGTPVLNALGTPIRAERGSISFQNHPRWTDPEFDGTIKTWETPDQAAVDPNDPATWKFDECVLIDACGSNTIGMDAIPMCFTVENFTEMTLPEYIRAVLHAVGIRHDVHLEEYALTKFDSFASQYVVGAADYAPLTPDGAVVKIADILDRMVNVASFRDRGLASGFNGWTAIVEAGFLGHLEIDKLAAAQQEAAIRQILSDFGINNIVETTDASIGDSQPYSTHTINPVGAAPIAPPARPDSWTLRLFKPGSFVVLSHDDMPVRMVPDIDSMKQNRQTFFGEEYLGIGRLSECAPVFTVEFNNLCATGGRTARQSVTC